MTAKMLPSDWVAGEIAVIGLARSGRAVARLLADRGARVYVSDAGSGESVVRAAAELTAKGIAVDVGRHDLDRVGRASLVVTSPGVPPDASPLVVARERGVPVVSEIEVGLRAMPGLKYIAITGTNGKTTTTALVAHLLSAVGADAVAGGNIGTPLAEIAGRPVPPAWVALELSSYQLHDTPSVAPRVGVLTNLSANHLDRYHSVEEYFGDKALLFRNADRESQWVTNADDPVVQQMVALIAGSRHSFSVRTNADGYLDQSSGTLMLLGEPLISRADLPLLGEHNAANALAAALAVAVADPAHRTVEARRQMAAALAAFSALEHRIEPVVERDGVLWINDSKSTNVTSTLVALKGMDRPTVLLMGGRHKGEPYTALEAELRRTVREVIAYGEAGPIITNDLAGLVPVTQLGSSFVDVVDRARAVAQPGDAILLSPACSSFDMFDNYEKRGREFKRLAREAATD